jgi:hypothetical protein
MLKYGFEWYGASKPVSISQINRTLRDLHTAGIITYETRIDDPIDNGLPQRVKYWQLLSDVDKNKLIADVRRVCGLARKAHGTFFLTKDRYFDKPMDADQKNAIIKDLKALMQKTHPDKIDGLGDQFKRLQTMLAYVRSNVDLLSDAA